MRSYKFNNNYHPFTFPPFKSICILKATFFIYPFYSIEMINYSHPIGPYLLGQCVFVCVVLP